VLTSPLAVSNAQKTVADDKADLDSAQGTYYWWLDLQKQSQDQMSKANADMIVAKSDLKDAQDNYNKYDEAPDNQKDKAIAYQKIYAVQQRIKDIQNRINLYSIVDPLQMAKYKAAVDVAKAKLADDEALLTALNGGELPQTPTGTSSAQLTQARLNADLAQVNLKNSQLIAPFDGTVAEIDLSVGTFMPAGKTGITVIDPLHLHVETTDLSERDVANVKVGQEVAVTIKPLNQTTKGKVTAISPQADTLGGDVVYKTFIQLDTLPDGALPGMSVTVEFLAQ
jgi:multidrug resistance efflux pump